MNGGPIVSSQILEFPKKQLAIGIWRLAIRVFSAAAQVAKDQVPSANC